MFQRKLGGLIARRVVAAGGGQGRRPPARRGAGHGGGDVAPAAAATHWHAIGPGEGELNLVIWAGYAERGAVVAGLRLGHAVRGQDRLHGQHDRA